MRETSDGFNHQDINWLDVNRGLIILVSFEIGPKFKETKHVVLDIDNIKDPECKSPAGPEFLCIPSFSLLFIIMKNNVKKIITEAVLGFLNEGKEEIPSNRKKVLVEEPFDENVKKKFLKAIQTKDR